MTNTGADDADREKHSQELLQKGAQDVIVPELLETYRQEKGYVDVNVLLVQIFQKTPSVEESVDNSERILALAQKYEDQRVVNFLRMADAIIDVKNRDPDEQEKRRNNRIRRWLKGTVGTCALGSLVGGAFCVTSSASIVVTSLLLAAGAMALSMSAVLASGESMSSNDVVRIVGAMREMMPWTAKRPQTQRSTQKRSRKDS